MTGRRKVRGHRSQVTAILLMGLVLLPAVAAGQQTVIVVRHAERADGGAGASAVTGTPADPPLSAAGEVRAAKLAAMLADAGITAIVATEFRRTRDTGRPLASRLGLAVQVVPARETAALVAKLKADHAKGVVLLIGHSNTVPDLIQALGGRTVTMRDDEYDAMYILTPATGALTLIRYAP